MRILIVVVGLHDSESKQREYSELVCNKIVQDEINTGSNKNHLKCYYDETIGSPFSSHCESSCVDCSIGEIFGSNFKR